MEKHFDKLELTSYVTGDLSPEKNSAVESHCQSCETCAAYVEKLKAEQMQFLENNPFDGSVDESDSTVVHTFPTNIRRAVTSIAALIVVAFTVQLWQNSNSETEGFRVKGGADFSILVENRNGAIEERESDVYYPGERIQVCYSTVDTAYLILMSIDSNGTLSRYFPTRGDSSMKINPGVNIPLSNSIRLDSYIGEEKLIMAFSNEPLSVAKVESQIKTAFAENSLDSLRLNDESDVQVRTIQKQVRDEE